MAPRTAEQFETIREESRRAIVTAALELFARHGYEKTSVRMIAAEAGVSQGLMYNYFAGKEDLLHAIFMQGMADIGESFTLADAGETAAEKIAALIRGSVEVAKRNQHFWRLFHALRMQPSVAEGLATEIAGWNRQVLSYLGSLLKSAGEEQPAAMARLLFAVIDGIVQHYLLDPEGYPVKKVVDRAVATFDYSV